MKFLNKIYDGLEQVSGVTTKILDGLSALLMALCTLDLAYQVLYRFVIVKFTTISSPFTEEFARYALIWITYLAIASCLRSGDIAAVNFVYDRLSPVPKKILYYITRVFIVIFLYFGIRYGYAAILNNLSFRSPMIHLPGLFIYSAPFVGCILLAFETLIELIGVSIGRLEPFEPRHPEVVSIETLDDIPEVSDEKEGEA